MRTRSFLLILLVAIVVGACARRQAPVARPMPPPVPPAAATESAPPSAVPAPERIAEPLPVPPEPLVEETIANRSLDDLNRNSPLQPVFFTLDSSELDDAGRAVVTANAALLRQNPSWVIMVEGHCDERGTVEYNLALGERRAGAVRAYLLSLGIAPGRVTTVSYGNEFPFDPGHDEGAWSRNRRAHFVITSR